MAVLLYACIFFILKYTVFASDTDGAAAASESQNVIYGWDVHNGAYIIDVESDTPEFQIENCVLIVTDGEMEANLTLAGNDYSKLFWDTGEGAKEADSSAYVPGESDADGNETFHMPVEALNQTLWCSAFSESKGAWEDHEICFLADSLPGGSLKSTASRAYQSHDIQALDLEDGTYTAEVTMTGGTGKASIESPVTLVILDGRATASLIWSSEHYDYMIVNGEQYLAVNETGNSVFEVPVIVFDEPFAVIGDTTAMSEPHEIEYHLTFDSASLERVDRVNQAKFAVPVLVVIAVVIAVISGLAVSRKKNNSDYEGKE